MKRKKAEVKKPKTIFTAFADSIENVMSATKELEANMAELQKVYSATPHAEPTAPRLLTEGEVKRVEVTHVYHFSKGWVGHKKIVGSAEIYYLGKCQADGDIFMQQKAGYIFIYKGHLNALTD